MQNDNSILEDVHIDVRKNSGRRKALIIIIAFIVVSILKAISVIIVRNKYADYLFKGKNELHEIGFINSLLSIAYSFIILAFAISFILWFSRAYKNLNRINSPLKFNASITIWAWFIPIANFILPYLTFKDLVVKTEFEVQKNVQKSIIGNFESKNISIWWWTFIIGNFLPLSSIVFNNGGYNSNTILNFLLINIFSNVVLIMSSVYLIIILKEYAKIEDKLYHIPELELV